VLIVLVIQEAAEMYLKTILRLQQSTGYVRSVDIAREMNYSKPTVSEQMKKCAENDFIIIEPDGQILLTDKGLAIAKRTLERHHVLTDILVKIPMIGKVQSLNASVSAGIIIYEIIRQRLEKLG